MDIWDSHAGDYEGKGLSRSHAVFLAKESNTITIILEDHQLFWLNNEDVNSSEMIMPYFPQEYSFVIKIAIQV
jgi:hypothetical protein